MSITCHGIVFRIKIRLSLLNEFIVFYDCRGFPPTDLCQHPMFCVWVMCAVKIFNKKKSGIKIECQTERPWRERSLSTFTLSCCHSPAADWSDELLLLIRFFSLVCFCVGRIVGKIYTIWLIMGHCPSLRFEKFHYVFFSYWFPMAGKGINLNF